jgi:signal transduction histidine kinase
MIAFVASRRARQLEARVHEQHQREVAYTGHLQRLSAQLLRAQEDERRRIARELHDEVGQGLSALKLELAAVERAEGSPQFLEALTEARGIADRTLHTIRDLSQTLHPSMLDDLGLSDTANWYLRAFSRRTGIPAELAVEHLDQRLTPDIETCTYRVLQEAMTNIARHAHATRCRVHIARAERSLRVTIEDNGRGIGTFAAPAAEERGLGLMSVRERVANLGGSVSIANGYDGGTVLTVELPVGAPS